VFGHNLKGLVCYPGGVAYLNGVPVRAVQERAKVLKQGFIKLQAWGQLEENRSKLLIESFCRGIKPLKRLFAILKPLCMGYEFVCFDCPQKALRGPFSPRFKGLRLWEPVKGGIKFDCVKLGAIKF